MHWLTVLNHRKITWRDETDLIFVVHLIYDVQDTSTRVIGSEQPVTITNTPLVVYQYIHSHFDGF